MEVINLQKFIIKNELKKLIRKTAYDAELCALLIELHKLL